MNAIYTIGHSTHAIERFLELLIGAGIKALADVRKYPGSRRLPQFNQETLDTSLQTAGIDYRWFPELCGRRPRLRDDLLPTPRPDNSAWRNDSFRNYADYMATESFAVAIEALLDIAQRKSTAYMCSEGLFWKCHRRLISDFLLIRNVAVWNIMPDGKIQSHVLTPGAAIQSGWLCYPAPPIQHQTQLF